MQVRTSPFHQMKIRLIIILFFAQLPRAFA